MKKPIKGLVVDGGCEGNPGPMSLRIFDLEKNWIIYNQERFDDGTNNIAEFLSIIIALKNYPEHIVYTDSNTAISWIEKEKVNSSFLYFVEKLNIQNSQLLSRIKRSIEWLKENPDQKLRLKKWDSKKWGENPADFGRK